MNEALFPLPPATARSVEIALAEARLGRGDPRGALEAAREAVGMLDVIGGVEEGEPRCRLALAEALAACGGRSSLCAARSGART